MRMDPKYVGMPSTEKRRAYVTFLASEKIAMRIFYNFSECCCITIKKGNAITQSFNKKLKDKMENGKLVLTNVLFEDGKEVSPTNFWFADQSDYLEDELDRLSKKVGFALVFCSTTGFIETAEESHKFCHEVMKIVSQVTF